MVSRLAQSCRHRERSIRLSHCCERNTSTVTTVSVWTMTAAWGARWCHREKGDGVRSRFLVKQFNDAKQGDFFTYTPRAEAMRILLTAATLLRHTIISVAIMYTPVKEGHEILVQAPPEYGAEGMVWRLRRSLYGLREAAQRFQEFLRPHCTRSRGHTHTRQNTHSTDGVAAKSSTQSRADRT